MIADTLHLVYVSYHILLAIETLYAEQTLKNPSWTGSISVIFRKCAKYLQQSYVQYVKIREKKA